MQSGLMTIAQIRDKRGWLTKEAVAVIAADNHTRLTPMLVRCGSCRFVAAAQDVGHIIAALEKAGDYVRDVSLRDRPVNMEV